jgi:hypothetical protein
MFSISAFAAGEIVKLTRAEIASSRRPPINDHSLDAESDDHV